MEAAHPANPLGLSADVAQLLQAVLLHISEVIGKHNTTSFIPLEKQVLFFHPLVLLSKRHRRRKKVLPSLSRHRSLPAGGPTPSGCQRELCHLTQLLVASVPNSHVLGARSSRRPASPPSPARAARGSRQARASARGAPSRSRLSLRATRRELPVAPPLAATT